MIDGVADQVSQRGLDGLDQSLVQLGFHALHADAHLFGAHQGKVAERALQRVQFAVR